MSVDWENSDLRVWMNSGFYKKAFSGVEKCIISTIVTEGCEDYIFALSEEELDRYLPQGNPIRQSISTPKVKEDMMTYKWWLRDTNVIYSRAAICDDIGNISNNKIGNVTGVRPAMWIDIDLEN